MMQTKHGFQLHQHSSAATITAAPSVFPNVVMHHAMFLLRSG